MMGLQVSIYPLFRIFDRLRDDIVWRNRLEAASNRCSHHDKDSVIVQQQACCVSSATEKSQTPYIA